MWAEFKKSIPGVNGYASRPLVMKMVLHWGRVTHICVRKPNIIRLDNGLVSTRRQDHCYNFVNLILRNKLQWHVNRNPYIFIPENACVNILSAKASILSRSQCIKAKHFWRNIAVLFLLPIHIIISNALIAVNWHNTGCKKMSRFTLQNNHLRVLLVSVFVDTLGHNCFRRQTRLH